MTGPRLSSTTTCTIGAAAFCIGTCVGILLSKTLSRGKEDNERNLKVGDEGVKTRTTTNIVDPTPTDMLPPNSPAPRRYGSVIRLRPGYYTRYRELHDNVWQQVLDTMTRANIRNFVIYHHHETRILFQHFEWIGHWKTPCRSRQEEEKLFESDMSIIANDPVTKEWWKECEPCQEPFSQWQVDATPPSRQGLSSASGNDDSKTSTTTASWWAPCECVAYGGHWPLAYAKEQRDADFVKLSSAFSV